MAKIDRVLDKAKENTKIAIYETSKVAKRAVKWLLSDEGQVALFALEMGVCLGAALTRRQDAKATGLTTKELALKVKDYRNSR